MVKTATIRVDGADGLVGSDLHAGDQVEALEPFAIFDVSSVEEKSRAMAYAYGLGYAVRTERSSSPIAGTSSTAAAEVGIPAITAEAGGCGLIDDVSVGLHLNGIRQVLSSLGVLPALTTALRRPVELSSGWVWLRSSTGGWWASSISPGEHVKAGELVGTVRSLDGRDIEEVRAPADGVPLFVTTSPAVGAEGLLMGVALE